MNWWSEPPHRWLAERERERADSDAVARIGDRDLVISLSGGADSTSTYLHLLETGFLEAWEAGGGRVLRIFMDTGWELPETYAYVDTLERRLGKIQRLATWVPGPNEAKPEGYDFLTNVWATPGKVMDGDRWAMARVIETRLGHYSPMVRLMFHWNKVPSSVRKWCTGELKMEPAKAFLADCADPVNVLGIRAEESFPRAKQPAWEWAPGFDAWIWRPIKWRTRADRVAIHTRHGVAPNPLYLIGDGAGHVGCGICVHSGKDDVRHAAKHHRWFLDILADIEQMLLGLSAPAEYPFWFTLSDGGRGHPVTVAEAIAWANTTRGGRQQMMFRPPVDPGCSVWGLCDVASGGNNK